MMVTFSEERCEAKHSRVWGALGLACTVMIGMSGWAIKSAEEASAKASDASKAVEVESVRTAEWRNSMQAGLTTMQSEIKDMRSSNKRIEENVQKLVILSQKPNEEGSK